MFCFVLFLLVFCCGMWVSWVVLGPIACLVVCVVFLTLCVPSQLRSFRCTLLLSFCGSSLSPVPFAVGGVFVCLGECWLCAWGVCFWGRCWWVGLVSFVFFRLPAGFYSDCIGVPSCVLRAKYCMTLYSRLHKSQLQDVRNFIGILSARTTSKHRPKNR